MIAPILAAVPPGNPRPVDAAGLRTLLAAAAAGTRPEPTGAAV